MKKIASILLISILPIFASSKFTFNDEIVRELKEYFSQECCSDVTNIEESSSGDSRTITFRNDEMMLLLAYVDDDSHRFLYGDLDGNGEEDLLLMVATNGGGCGSNAANVELILFLNFKSQGYKIHLGITGHRLSNCSNGGYIEPQEIKNGKIVCKTSCWQEGDSRWDYTDIYKTTLALKGSELVVESSVSLR